MGKSTIAWTDYTFNDWWGCSKVSPGCAHCHAANVSKRFNYDVWGVDKPRRLFTLTHRDQLRSWNENAKKKNRTYKVFIGSMMDIFENHHSIPPGRRESLFQILPLYENLIFLLLTKRIGNAECILPVEWFDNWPTNVWIGASIENNELLDSRLPYLKYIPQNFISFEPLLEAITPERVEDAARLSDWLIIGGESGEKARPFSPEWVYPFISAGKMYNTPVFVKQMGTQYAKSQGYKDKKGENMSEWAQELRIRQFPASFVKTLADIFKNE